MLLSNEIKHDSKFEVLNFFDVEFGLTLPSAGHVAKLYLLVWVKRVTSRSLGNSHCYPNYSPFQNTWALRRGPIWHVALLCPWKRLCHIQDRTQRICSHRSSLDIAWPLCEDIHSIGNIRLTGDNLNAKSGIEKRVFLIFFFIKIAE